MISQGNLTPAQVVQFNYISEHLNTIEQDPAIVATINDLPDATLNTGKMFFVTSDSLFYYSDGVTWKYPAVATTPVVVGGSLWSWGYNYGALGDGTTIDRSSPGTTAGGGTDWAQVSAGNYHTAAIKTDGTLWTWGYNGYGQVGDGTTTDRLSPGTTLGGGTNWKQVSAGKEHSIAAIKTDGTLWTWGYNGYGQLGDDTTIDRSSPGTTAGGGTTWKQVSAGGYLVAAIKTDGTLWTWGANWFGQLGDGTLTNRSSPGTTAGGGTTWSQAAASPNYIAAVKTDGTLWAWGMNDNGQLGITDTIDRSSPVEVAGGGTTWSYVNCGWEHTVALKTDGTLWTWGSNLTGQLGDGTTTNRNSPVTTVGAGTTWSQVDGGKYHSVAIKTDGTLWAWGWNTNGELGGGATTARSSPGTTTGGGTNWSQVSVGQYYTTAIQLIG